MILYFSVVLWNSNLLIERLLVVLLQSVIIGLSSTEGTGRLAISEGDTTITRAFTCMSMIQRSYTRIHFAYSEISTDMKVVIKDNHKEQ
jgi:hypothetical protein